MTFEQFRLSPPILQAIAAEGYEVPSPIQAAAIPPALEGHDILGTAQTGTGKTAAFALPIIHRLTAADGTTKDGKGPPRGRGRAARAIVLCPTRELAAQILESFRTYGRRLPLKCAAIYGGVGQGKQVSAIRNGLDIIVATPGRLIDLIEQGHLDLTRIETVVLDEADRMLDMGFIHPIRRIMGEIPRKRQTMLLSATISKEIRTLADDLLRKPVVVETAPESTTAELVDQRLYLVDKGNKPDLLIRLFEVGDMSRTLVFTRTKYGADRLVRILKKAKIRAEAIHGDKSQAQRTRAMDAFRSGKAEALVATDVAARGIDVDGVSHVVNFDMPVEPESYVHRIGRTARAGASGHAISMCDRPELELLRAIERRTDARPQLAKDHSEFCYKMPSDGGRSASKAAKAAKAAAAEARTKGRKKPRPGGPRKNARPNAADPRPEGKPAAKPRRSGSGPRQEDHGQTGANKRRPKKTGGGNPNARSGASKKRSTNKKATFDRGGHAPKRSKGGGGSKPRRSGGGQGR